MLLIDDRKKSLILRIISSNANMTTIDNVKLQLQSLIANRPGVNFTILFQYSPAFNHVHEILSENEKISGYCIGSLTRAGKQVKAGKWLAICTNQQLVLLHKGMFTNVTYFKIPLTDIAGVTSKLSWLSNKIKILDKETEWEMYQINKTDLQFFELALNNAIAALKK